MRFGILLFGSIIFLSAVTAVVLSKHGLRDLYKFHGQIEATRIRVSGIEEENRHLKHQLDLLSGATDEILERQVRASLGWVKADEIVYFEKSGRK